MKKPALRIQAFRLPHGEIPNVELPDGWSVPVYFLGEDGERVISFGPGASRFRVPTFEVHGRTREEAVEEILRRAADLCLFAGFAGTAVVMVETDVSFRPSGHHLIQAALVFSGWGKSDEENLAGFPASVAVEDEEHLLAMRDAYAVLES